MNNVTLKNATINEIGEVEAALATLDDFIANNNHHKDFDDAMTVARLMELNNTVGLTLEDGKTLKRLGINVELEDFSLNRHHLGTEALSAGGKAGLYGLAIGALLVVLGFIIKKIISWFKGDGGSSTPSGKSDKELAKTVPSMDSNPSTTVKLPEFLADRSTLNSFMARMEGFLSYSGMALDSCIQDGKGMNAPEVAAFIKKETSAFLVALKAVGYNVAGDHLADIDIMVKATPIEDLPYGKEETMDVFINKISFSVNKASTRAFTDLQKRLEDLSKEEGAALSIMDFSKQLSKVISTVLTQNFVRTMAIIKLHNVYSEQSTAIYLKAFNETALNSVFEDKDLKTYFIRADRTNTESLEKAYKAIIKAKKASGHVPIQTYAKLAELTVKHEKNIAEQLSKSTGDKKK